MARGKGSVEGQPLASLMRHLVNVILAASLSLGASALHAEASRALLDVQERLYLERDGARVFRGSTLYEPSLVDAFYRQVGYRPVWTDRAYAREMLNLLASSTRDGLNPADYHYDKIQELVEVFDTPWSDKDTRRVMAEVLLTDGIVLLGKHLLQGKVDPRTLDSSWNYRRRSVDPSDVARSLALAIQRREVAGELKALTLDTPFYRLMRDKLGYYRELAATERFTPVPASRVLRKGDQHANVVALRRRLHEMGYLASQAVTDQHFNTEVENAVRALQYDHALAVDGVIGAQSFRALNLSPSDRVDMLRINLDRARWISQDMSDEYLVVNIAGYELYYLRDRRLIWQTPVMVGTIDTRTPIFRKRLRYLEFNPTWNVPRSLLARSIYPLVAGDLAYIDAMRYRFYDGDRQVDPKTIDWQAYSGGSFPYRVVQMPGPNNAMGRVKFMFPNRHAVYLHDTPSRELFQRSQRAFSAGCIRVRNPLELARLLLNDEEKWAAAQIQALVDGGTPQQVVQMERPVDVQLMYWTVSPEGGQRLEFHDDIYQLDAAALAALNAPPRPSPFDG
jgi:murein L,D-transpeptidase YcbB/YkuD